MRRVLTGILLAGALAGPVLAGDFTQGLERFVEGRPASESIKVLVTLQEQADIATLDAELRERRASLAERHETVISALQGTARRTQPALLRELNTLKAAGKVNGFTPYWITNAVVVNAPIAVLRDLAARPDVESVDVDLVVQSIQPVEPFKGRPAENDGQRTITAGLAAINADDVWNILGINGSGALVGGIDTGVDYTHSTLVSRWRGSNGHPTSECWLDAAGLGHSLPQDANGHGTHTMGTMVGGNDIGVAPGAQWIATNCINMSTGSAFDNAVIASFQFMADPDGNGATLDDVPDVVQNSWGVNENFSGYLNCDTRWWAAIDNCEAAGVCVTFSAGNEGSGASTLRSPADRCITPYSCFSVGATDPVNGNLIASFSSRGPSTCSPAPYPIKPEVSAPGVNTYSAAPGGGYATLSGTSMAGPHVAGVVALMRAANPDVDVNTIKQILMDTCTDMGTAGEDNTYGWGQINAYEAVLAVMQNYGSVAGVVTSAASGLPIAGATVDNLAGSQLVSTNSTGAYSMSLEAGTYSLEYASFGYVSQTQSVTVVADATTTRNVALATAPTALLSGYVYDPDNNPVPAATIDFTNVNWPSATSDGNGYYSVAIPVGTTYEITAFASGLGGDSRTVIFNGAQQVDFHLPLIEGFESGNFSAFPWSMGGNAPWTVVTDVVHDGTHAARSGAINHNQSSTMTLTLPVPSPSSISFWYKVSSEAGYDYLRFYIDGVQQGQWAGEVDWTQATYAVSAGNHTFSWTYSKDVSVVNGSDCAWVDGITPPEAAYPDLNASPLAFARTVAPGGTASDLLSLGNSGEGTLTWAASVTTFSSLSTVPTLELAKGERDPRPGQSGRASGGPDAFGYSWTDSNEPGGPAYGWFDISAIGTTVGTGDDANYGPFTLGFPFEYYGTAYTTVRVCTNGWISFTSTSSALTNQGIPNTASPNALLAAFWDDLNPAAGGTLKYYADGANQRFIVQWTAVPIYNTSSPQTFQIVLHADGRIVYQYQTVTAATGCTVGIENAAGTDGLQVVFNGAYLTNNLAIEFATEIPWLSVSPTSGSVLPGGSGTVTVGYDATGLAEGTYTGQVNLTSNDPGTPSLTLPVVLTVGVVVLDPVSLSIHYLSPGLCQLTWPAAVGATSYDVYQAASLGAPFTLLANTAATSLSVTAGQNDLRLYRVVARN